MSMKTLHEARIRHQRSDSEVSLVTSDPSYKEYHNRLQKLIDAKNAEIADFLKSLDEKYDPQIRKVESELAMYMIMSSEIKNG